LLQWVKSAPVGRCKKLQPIGYCFFIRPSVVFSPNCPAICRLRLRRDVKSGSLHSRSFQLRSSALPAASGARTRTNLSVRSVKSLVLPSGFDTTCGSLRSRKLWNQMTHPLAGSGTSASQIPTRVIVAIGSLLPSGFEPESEAREASMIDRTTLREHSGVPSD
jgi:hypothetical protein